MKKIFLSLTALLSVTVFVNAQNSSPYWSLAGNSNATSSSKLGTTNAINLRLYTNNLERARITTSGLVGIGTTSPTDKLHVNSPSGTNAFRAQVNGSTKLIVHSNGNVGIGTTSPTYKLHVSGNARITTGLSVANGGIVSYNSSGTAVYGSGDNYGLSGYASNDYGSGVYGNSRNIGVMGEASNYGTYGAAIETGAYGYGDSYGTYGYSLNVGAYGSGENYGTYGYSYSGNAAYGISYDGTGVGGSSTNGNGGNFYSTNGYGMRAGTQNSAGNWAGVFDGNVYSFGTFQTSDKNLKKNIKELADAMSIINRLKPKNYEFRNDEKYATLNLPKGTHFGLIAQDLQEVFPNLVSEVLESVSTAKQVTPVKPGKDGKPLPVVKEGKETKENINIKTVNYVELIPIMIKAMQEQEAAIEKQNLTIEKQNTTIEKQNIKIEDLTRLVHQLSLIPVASGSVKLTGASLGQSSPNPNSTSTKISYNVPGGFSKAELVITNEAGQKINQMQLNKSGLVGINTSSMSAGTYFYTLYVNGTSVDTKKMVVVRK